MRELPSRHLGNRADDVMPVGLKAERAVYVVGDSCKDVSTWSNTITNYQLPTINYQLL